MRAIGAAAFTTFLNMILAKMVVKDKKRCWRKEVPENHLPLPRIAVRVAAVSRIEPIQFGRHQFGLARFLLTTFLIVADDDKTCSLVAGAVTGSAGLQRYHSYCSLVVALVCLFTLP